MFVVVRAMASDGHTLRSKLRNVPLFNIFVNIPEDNKEKSKALETIGLKKWLFPISSHNKTYQQPLKALSKKTALSLTLKVEWVCTS